MFKLTPGIHDKYKGVFGNLLQTLSYYIKYGKEWLCEDLERVWILHDMAMKSMFYNIKNGLIRTSNADGSFLFQFILIGLQGTSAYDSFLPTLLDKTIERMAMNPMNSILKSALLGNIHAALVYNTPATIWYLEQNSLSENFVYEVIQNDFINYHIY